VDGASPDLITHADRNGRRRRAEMIRTVEKNLLAIMGRLSD
jgi:hypothetical protein